ncbi:O-antigen/teichoic acid export membrane protein [Nocardioides salarius]|uniref:O-antigen/teichoic acid export membrane protein n=1 Tax=Nocardioides salarius TaxID=374513 RepID=A0ABS2MFQ1_9ACTN|nr:polysaccharide biosynthesis C-terminal domain-containing protein [Nocardioides salarius]MBM7510023.1 O-antigen/teichoic acid export membrane protein [Nocardioides salarius]
MAEQVISDTTQRAARNAVVRAVAEVLGKVATLAWTVAAARMLPADDFGAVFYALTIMLVLTSLAAWGFDSGLTRRGSAVPESLPRLFRATQVWKSALSVPLLVAAGLLLAGVPAVGSWTVLALMLAAGLPELWSQTIRTAAACRQVSAGVSTALVVQRVATAAAVLAALGAGTGSEGVAAGFLAGTVVGWLAHVLAARRLDVRQPLRELERADLAAAVRETVLVGVSGLVLMLLFRVDVLILGHLEGAGSVAVYTVAYRLLETVLFVTYAINAAVLPVLSATRSRETRLLGCERAIAVGGFVYLPFVAVSLTEGRDVIDLLFGATYAASAAPVLAWLAPAAMLLALASFSDSLLHVLGRHRALLASSSAALGVNVALNLILIPVLGATGAALATTLSYLVQAVVVLGFLQRVGERPRVLSPLLSSGAASVVLVALLVLLHLPVLVELVAGAVVYLGAWLLLVRRFAPEQQQVLVGLVRRRGVAA